MGTHPGRRSILSRAADSVRPPRSLLSDRTVHCPGAIEAPLAAAAEDGALCGACTAQTPTFASARTALV